MTLKKILILGGTAEAREIAALLLRDGHDVTSSLAGVTSKPLLPDGKLRVGGFGGAEGLRIYLKQESIDVLVDATHPYAAIISTNAFSAVQNSSTQLLRFERPAWLPVAGDSWIFVASLFEAASHLPPQAMVFLTTGRKELAPFLDRGDVSGVVRTIEPPTQAIPPNWRIVLDRPPHRFDDEIAFFKQEKFTHIISKNAGGVSTRAKLTAARHTGIPVIMIQRPHKPDCETFSEIPALIKRLGTSGCSG